MGNPLLAFLLRNIYPLHSYGKSPFFNGKTHYKMAIFNSYVKLPGGTHFCHFWGGFLQQISAMKAPESREPHGDHRRKAATWRCETWKWVPVLKCAPKRSKKHIETCIIYTYFAIYIYRGREKEKKNIYIYIYIYIYICRVI